MKWVGAFVLVLLIGAAAADFSKFDDEYLRRSNEISCTTPVCEILEGLLKALGLKEPVETCIGDVTTTVQDFEDAVEYFHQGKDQQGVLKLAEALNDFAVSVQGCQVDKVCSWLEELAKKIMHTDLQWLDKVAVILVDGSNIYQDLYQIGVDFNHTDYQSAGKDIAKLVLEVEKDTGCTKGACGVIAGMLRILGVVVEDLGPCKDDLDAAFSKLEDAVDAFQQKDYSTALSDLATALDDIAQAAKGCQLTELADLINEEAKLLGKAEIKDLDKVVEIIIDGADIYSDLYNAVNDWASGNYPAFGADIADLLLKLQSSKCTAPACIVAEGILEILQIVAHDMGQCRTELENALADFEKAASEFSSKDYADAVADFAAGLDGVAKALTDCELPELSSVIVMLAKRLASADIQKLETDVKIIVEGADLFDDLYQCAQAIAQKDYAALGRDLGTLIQDIESAGCTSKACIVIDNLLKALRILVGDLGSCRTELETAFDEIEVAVQLFDQKDYHGFLSNMSNALYLLADGVDTCGLQSLSTLLQAEAKALGLGDVKIVGDVVQIIVNSADIYKDVYDAVQDYKSGDYAAFGRDIADLLTHLQQLSCTSPICVIVDGILEALQLLAQDLTSCSGDLSQAYADIELAVQQFDAHEYDQCIASLGNALKALADGVKDCDVQGLGDILEDLAQQLHMGNVKIIGEAVSILVGGADLYEELYQACVDFKGGDFRNFGIDLGNFLLDIAKMRSKFGCASPFCLIVEGIVQALEVETTLKACKSDLDNVWDDMESAVSNFEDRKVKSALKDIAEGLHELAEGISDCKVAEVAEIVEKLAEKLGFGELFWLEDIVKIVVDGAEIYDDVYGCVVAWDDRDYVVFGFDVGKLIIKLVEL